MTKELPGWFVCLAVALSVTVILLIYVLLWSQREQPVPRGVGPGPESYLPPPKGSIRLERPPGEGEIEREVNVPRQPTRNPKTERK